MFECLGERVVVRLEGVGRQSPAPMAPKLATCFVSRFAGACQVVVPDFARGGFRGTGNYTVEEHVVKVF